MWHFVLVLAALLGEGADTFVHPLVAVDLGLSLGDGSSSSSSSFSGLHDTIDLVLVRER